MAHLIIVFACFSYASAYNSAYGADGYQYMRNFDPSYDAFFTDGPTVDDKWRSTYPYVPTSYSHHASGKREKLKKDIFVGMEILTVITN